MVGNQPDPNLQKSMSERKKEKVLVINKTVNRKKVGHSKKTCQIGKINANLYLKRREIVQLKK